MQSSLKNKETKSEADCSDNCETKIKNKTFTCKLSNPELKRRKETIIKSLKAQIISKNEIKNGFSYQFAGSDKMVDELTEFIKTERLCCDFFIFNLSIRGDKSGINLEITAEEDVKDFIRLELNSKTNMKILVLCTGNSCRSQMAEGYLRHFAGSKAEIYSAGVETHGVNQRAIETMKEDGIDISSHSSNHISEYNHIGFDFIITVCDNAKEHCPFFPAKAKKFHQNFPDPGKATGTEDEIKQQFREVRQQIKNYCKQFVMDNIPA